MFSVYSELGNPLSVGVKLANAIGEWLGPPVSPVTFKDFWFYFEALDLLMLGRDKMYNFELMKTLPPKTLISFNVYMNVLPSSYFGKLL